MTFKKSSILTGFQECRLVPYNLAIVLKKIKEYQSSSSPVRSTTPSTTQIRPSITSLTARSLKKQATELRNATLGRQKAL
jgi:hypothetical protein